MTPKEPPRNFYLHDRCLVDPKVAHKERFEITTARNPEGTLRYGPMSLNQAQEVRNYLYRVWKKQAEAQEKREALETAPRINSGVANPGHRGTSGTKYPETIERHHERP